MLVLVPSVTLAAGIIWFCLSQRKPLPIAAAVAVILFAIVDHFAYSTFCQVAFRPEGLRFSGGGVLWRRLRKERTLRWADYVYILTPGKAHWARLEVVDKAKCDAGRPGSEYQCSLTLALHPRISAYNEFDALAREILVHNPEVRVRWRRARRSPDASPVTMGRINVSGDDEFRRRTIQALSLLQERDPVNYTRVQRYIANVASVESQFYGVSMAIDFEAATIEVYRKTPLLTSAAKWYATEIVGQMCRYMLHHRFRLSLHSPKHVGERLGIIYRAQVRSLRRLGGSEAAIQRLEKAAKERLSVPGDDDVRNYRNTLTEGTD